MGHSMGGLIAQMLAAEGKARALVLPAPAWPRGVLHLSWKAARGLGSMVATPAFWRKPVKPSFRGSCIAILNRLPPNEQRLVYDNFLYDSGRALAEIAFWYADRSRATYVDTARVRCPVLCVAGADDGIVPPSAVLRVARLYAPHATFLRFEGMGHSLIGEPGWERVADACAFWLRRRLPAEDGLIAPPSRGGRTPARARHTPHSRDM